MAPPPNSNFHARRAGLFIYIGSMPTAESEQVAGRFFAEAVEIMARLRGPGGCPWDREQSFDSIRQHTLEETYEVLDAIDRRNWPDLCEELGDLLLQVLFYSQMAAEAGDFDISEVIAGLNRKLIRRHPHVFGDEASLAAGNAAPAGMETAGIDGAQVLRNWEQIKNWEKIERTEKGEAPPSLLDSVPQSFPALLEASKLSSKAAKCGFDWADADGVFDKLGEEIGELREAIGQQGAASHGEEQRVRTAACVEEELGDLLFTAANLARKLGVNPELALRSTNRKFRRRFASMEGSSAAPLAERSAAQLEALWAEAKRAEAGAERSA
jgi:ATP diphosphatase